MKSAVIKTGGKQYLVHVGDELHVDTLKMEKGKDAELETLAIFDEEKDTIDLGAPLVKTKVKVQIIDNVKGEKVRVARFKAKSRYRKVTGFRAILSKIKVISI